MDIEAFCALFEIEKKTLGDVDLGKLLSREVVAEIQGQGYHILHDVISPDLVAEMREFWANKNGEASSSTSLRYGEGNYSHSFFGRYTRHFEFYWNHPRSKRSTDLSLLVHYARNIAIGYHPLYGLTFSPNRVGVYLAITHYPSGSGEMAVHVDPNYFLPVHFNIPLTFRGMHYASGGLNLHLKSGSINIDEKLRPGSMFLFNGSIPHSVEKIGGEGALPGSERSLGRLQMFSIPTEFVQSRKHSALRGLAYEMYGRFKYGLYRRQLGLKADHKNFR